MEAAQQAGFPMTPDLGGEVTTGVAWNQLSIQGPQFATTPRRPIWTVWRAVPLGHRSICSPAPDVLGLEIERGRCLGVSPGRTGRAARRRCPAVRRGDRFAASADAVGHRPGRRTARAGDRERRRPSGRRPPSRRSSAARRRGLPGASPGPRPRVTITATRSSTCRTPRPVRAPDILVMCLSVPFVRPTVGPLAAPAYVLVPCHLQPRSRGSVRLGSSDPREAAIIDPNYLGDPDDLAVLARGVEIAREIRRGKSVRRLAVEGGLSRTGLDERSRPHRLHPPGDGFLPPSRRHLPHRRRRRRGPAREGHRGIARHRRLGPARLPAAMCNAAVTAVAEKASDLVLAG